MRWLWLLRYRRVRGTLRYVVGGTAFFGAGLVGAVLGQLLSVGGPVRVGGTLVLGAALAVVSLRWLNRKVAGLLAHPSILVFTERGPVRQQSVSVDGFIPIPIAVAAAAVTFTVDVPRDLSQPATYQAEYCLIHMPPA